MKPRGRRDVRKALRECTLSFSDETERALASFEEYYEVMVETGARDGFSPAPIEDYRSMLRVLGPEHCRSVRRARRRPGDHLDHRHHLRSARDPILRSVPLL